MIMFERIKLNKDNNVVKLAKYEFKKRIWDLEGQKLNISDFGDFAEDIIKLYGFRFDPMSWMIRNISDVRRAFESLLFEDAFKKELSSLFFMDPEGFLQWLSWEVLAAVLLDTSVFRDFHDKEVVLNKELINILIKDIK